MSVEAEKNRNVYFLEANHVESNAVTSEPEPTARKHLPSPDSEEERFGSHATKANGYSSSDSTTVVPSTTDSSNQIPLQVPIKIEPKVFFANERTFLAWMHTCTLLAGTSIALGTFSERTLLGQIHGVILLPIAISFLLYSMNQYMHRAQMLRGSASGPYEDLIGPSILCVALMGSIVAHFSIQLYSKWR